MLKYPKKVGNIDGKEVIINNGKFGLYISYNDKNYPVKSDDINIDEMKEIIKKKDKDIIKNFIIDNISYSIRDGKYGPYISYKNGNKLEFKSIPKSYKIIEINEKDILYIINKKSRI